MIFSASRKLSTVPQKQSLLDGKDVQDTDES